MVMLSKKKWQRLFCSVYEWFWHFIIVKCNTNVENLSQNCSLIKNAFEKIYLFVPRDVCNVTVRF